MNNKGSRLGELLVSKRLITPAQLEQALQEQRSTREFLGALLVRRGWLTEEALLQVLAEQFQMTYAHLENEPVQWDAAKHFSSELLAQHGCFPLRMDGEAVTVAISNPLDVLAFSDFEKEAGFRKVRLVLMSTQDIQAALREFQRRCREGRTVA